MRAIKKINNNVALCIDDKGEEVIARGKGIGFGTFPYELDISRIERTYYGINNNLLSMINEISEDVLNISTSVIDKARIEISNPISSNIVFTLADHIQFVIKRNKEHMDIKLPIASDIRFLFETEYEIGKYALSLIKEKMGIWLPEEEAAYIALHIVNAEQKERAQKGLDNDEIVKEIVSIIEKEYGIQINEDNFNYSRFVSHMHYLFKRGKTRHLIESSNDLLYTDMKNNYPETYACEEKISDYLKDKLDIDLTDEEKLYLMLHINRLCTREDCYR